MSGMKKAIGGSIHRIREFKLEKVTPILSVSSISSPLRKPVTIGFSFVSYGISLKPLALPPSIESKQRWAVGAAFPVPRH